MQTEVDGWNEVPTLPSAVADWIVRGIVAERWPDGARLRETEIAEELGVSRGPVREALRMLHERGLVRHVPRVGAVVCGVSTATITEVYEMRAHIEAFICRLAVPRLREEDLARLQALLTEIQALHEAGRHDEMYAVCWQFREALYARAGHGTAMELVRSLRARLHTVPQVLRGDPAHHELAVRFYTQVTEACVAGDTRSVEAQVSTFMIRAGEQVVARFRADARTLAPAAGLPQVWS
ncbi:MAG TPA: GntR family transcriptional regulator [Pseudonocardiaceae bacterium]